MGRDHEEAPVDTARGKSSHCVEVRKFTGQVRKRLVEVEENISHLVSAVTVRHGGHMRDPKRESSEMIVV